MEFTSALEQAAVIAQLIMRGAKKLGSLSPENLPLIPRIHTEVMLNRGDVHIRPEIKDVLIFGSLAEGQEEVGDIDLIVIDLGFYSSHFTRHTNTATRILDARFYERLAENLRQLLLSWFRLEDEDVFDVLYDPVDLHFLPESFFTERSVRDQIASFHHDPHFFQNAFSRLLRFNAKTNKFTPTDLSFFEERYGVNLDDLRRK